ERGRALDGLAAGREAFARSEAVLSGERAIVDSAMRAFAAGASDRLVLRTAQVAYLRAERVHLDAQVRLQQALGDLEAAVQPPLVMESGVEQGAGPPGRATPRR